MTMTIQELLKISAGWGEVFVKCQDAMELLAEMDKAMTAIMEHIDSCPNCVGVGIIMKQVAKEEDDP